MDLNMKQKALTLVGETIGTAVLVTAYSLNIQILGMGASMIYLMLIVLLYQVSGAHFNPAVTIAQFIQKGTLFDFSFVVMTIIAQVLGGLVAMTASMLFRGFGATAAPTITTAAPLLATANVLYKSRAASVVFIGSMFFTAFYVMVTLIARN